MPEKIKVLLNKGKDRVVVEAELIRRNSKTVYVKLSNGKYIIRKNKRDVVQG